MSFGIIVQSPEITFGKTEWLYLQGSPELIKTYIILLVVWSWLWYFIQSTFSAPSIFYSYHHMWCSILEIIICFSECFIPIMSTLHRSIDCMNEFAHIIFISGLNKSIWLLHIQWGKKPFKWFLKLNYFLYNSRMTKPNKFKFNTVVEYYVPNKFQVVSLHNLNFFLCY